MVGGQQVLFAVFRILHTHRAAIARGPTDTIESVDLRLCLACKESEDRKKYVLHFLPLFATVENEQIKASFFGLG